MERPDIEMNRVDGYEDIPEFIGWLTDTLGAGRKISIDTETCSVHDLWKYGRGYARLWQVGTSDCGWAIDARQWHGLVAEALDRIRRAKPRVVYANAKFDQHVSDREEGWGIVPWSMTDDVITKHRVMFPQEKLHGLKESAVELLGPWAGEGKRQLARYMERTGTNWDTVPTDAPEYWLYGVFDTCLTVLLDDKLDELGVPAWYEVERQYATLTWDMERRGLYINPEAIEYADSVWAADIERLTDILKGFGFDRPSSSQAVQRAFASLGFEPEVVSAKTGDPTYNKMVLRKMKETPGPVAEAAEHLMAFRTAYAWRNNYGTKLLRFADSRNCIHPGIFEMEARTGRSSIRTPALQTIPKSRITRNIFVPPPGQEMWAIDYQSQETRVLAALSEDPGLLKFFSMPDADYHQYVADIAGIPRSAAKVVNYARAYGAGPEKLASSAGVHLDEMVQYLARIDEAFPRAIRYKDEVTAAAERRTQEDGYPWVELPYGRRAALDPGREFTQALNTLIQGHGADVLKLAACRLASAGFGPHMVLPVHDEILMSFPKGEGREAAAEAARIMVDTRLSLPLTVDVTGPLVRWGDSVKED